MTREEFVTEIDGFLAAHGMNATRFGKLALNDTGFVHRLRRGGDTRLSTMEKIRAFMRRENEERSRRSSQAA